MHDFAAKLSDPRVAPSVERYLDRARGRRQSPPAAEATCENGKHGPISINLDLTLACDHRCAHCIDAELLNGGRHLERNIVLGTLELLARRGLRSVILIGGGEPTLHPFFEDVVGAIKKLDLQCAIVSNGSHNHKIASVARLLGAKDWVRLSLDAGTDRTFQALHRPRKPITLEHICRTAAALKARAPHVQLGFSFVVIWASPGQTVSPVADNVFEMHRAAVLAREHGFDYISFKPMLARDSRRAEIVNLGRLECDGTPEQTAIGDIRDCLREAQAVAGPGFRVVPSRNLLALLDGAALERSARQPSQCHVQQFRHVVTPNGIFACPAHRGNAGSRLADCSGYSTPEAFDDTARATEAQIGRFDAAVECSGVTCIYNAANWWLEELVQSGQPLQSSAAADFFL